MEEIFIQMVAEKNFLYDKTTKEYKDTDLKLQTWNEIGSKFNKTGSEAQTIFKSLREKYIREKKNMESKIRSSRKFKKMWHLLPLMAFLDDHIKPRTPVTNFARSEASSSSSASCNDINSVNHIEADDNMRLSFTNVIKSEEELSTGDVTQLEDPLFFENTSTPVREQKISLKIPPNNRKRANSDSGSDEQIVSVSVLKTVADQYKINNNNNTSNYSAFCLYLDAELCTMPSDDAEELKDEIMTLLVNKRREVRQRNKSLVK